jgi:hypothetical protein
MFFKQNKPDIQSELKYSLSRGYHQKEILKFLHNNLSEVANKLVEGANSSLSNTREDNITREINRILNDKLRISSCYLFHFESNIGPDLLIFATPYAAFSAPIFVIEAKRLPSTSTHDYVNGGIGRFKKEKHGKQHEIAAMLGYVQEKDFVHWFGKVNLWVSDLISPTSTKPRWTTEDQLSKIKVTDIGEYKSKHSRIKKDPITLYHFWIDLT